MASFGPLSGVDMNDPMTLALYNQVFLFKNDPSRAELLFINRLNPDQRTLQSIAHAFNLEYEYSTVTRIVRISRLSLFAYSNQPPSNGLESLLDNVNSNTFGNFDQAASIFTSNPSYEPLFAPQSLSMDSLPYTSNLHSSESLPGFANHREEPKTDCHQIGDDQTNLDFFDQWINFQAVEASTELSAKDRPHKAHEVDAHVQNGGETFSLCQQQTSPPPTSVKDQIMNPEFNPGGTLETAEKLSENDEGGHLYSMDEFLKNKASSSRNALSRALGRTGPTDASSRRQSANSAASSGYDEITFDSNSAYSGSQVSNKSGRRGGPLSGLARAGMNAVRKVGACWRCKFLKKTCDPDNPCALCPKGKKSNWEAVGCRRGLLKERMAPIILCQEYAGFACFELPARKDANEYLRKIIDSREKGLVKLDETMNSDENRGCNESMMFCDLFLPKGNAHIGTLFTKCFPGTRYSISKQHKPALLIPLHECILAIAWELYHTNISFGNKKTMEELCILLIEGAEYQKTHESDQLIAQSLICFRSCLEALQLKAAGCLQHGSHQACKPFMCTIQGIENVKMHISLYQDELSRVFFLKDNMQNKDRWWFSTFYSFCIQSFVRTALIELQRYDGRQEDVACREYLRLSVRLFIASSGRYDPLVRRGLEEMQPPQNPVHNARVAVGERFWSSYGISGSAGYLKFIFEDFEFEFNGSSDSSNAGSDSDHNEHHPLSGPSRPLSNDDIHNTIFQISTFRPKSWNPDSSSTQKNHRCKVCGKRFTRPSSLQTHMYSHTGKKPFGCDFPGCEKYFSVASNLRRHRKVHNSEVRSQSSLSSVSETQSEHDSSMW